MKYFFLPLLFLSFSLFSQENIGLIKNYNAEYTEVSPKIDGIIDDDVWNKVSIATNFRQATPFPKKPASQKTEVKLLYDNDALYIAARMYEANPDSINNFLTERDQIGNADFFFIAFNTYRDGINGEGFLVTPAGVQIDVKYSNDSETTSWDVVWESATLIDEKGWTAEIRIPYSALRFPEVEKQLWGINFGREIRRKRERSYWNLVDPTVDGFLTQTGRLSGIENIKPPVRLFFFPYTSSYAEFNSANGGGETYSFNAGMDVKYGLSDAFTLDMTLIPDFGQTRFDNQVLNLSAFEVQFNENRQFFTEGVELFTKADLFYSRRVGGRPFNFFSVDGQLDSVETIKESPAQSQLINATKVSGRNKNGLGVGIFNAVEKRELAVIKNSETKSERTVETNPLTNYNVLVLDQVLRNNSFVTLTNTNVTRDGSLRDANVSQLDLQLADKKNKYAVGGNFGMSHIFENNETVNGINWEASFEKISGNFTYELSHEQISDKYDPNDLGFLNINNIERTYIFAEYANFEPKKNFNFWRHNYDIVYERLYKSNEFVNFATTWSTVYGLKSFHAIGFNAGVEPVNTNDFFETRTFEQYYKYPKNFWFGGFFSSDYSRPFALDVRYQQRVFDEPGRHNTSLFISPRLRPNDKLFFVIDFTREENNNEIGFIDNTDGQITLGRRDLDVHIGAIKGSYIFNNKMALNLDLRHYWSTAVYDKLYFLDRKDGSLDELVFPENENDPIVSNENVSFNAFNIDLGFRWRFAPGSDINVVWKNIIVENGDPLERNYFNDLDQTLNAPQINNFSIKVLYFVDYLSLRREEKKDITLTPDSLNVEKKSTCPFSLILLAALAIFCMLKYSWYNSDRSFNTKIIYSDGEGYYQYLCSVFIEDNITNIPPSKTYSATINGKEVIKYYSGTAICMSPFFGMAALHAKLSNQVLDPYSPLFQKWISLGGIFFLILGFYFVAKFLRLYQLSEAAIAVSLITMFLGTNLFLYGVFAPALSHVYSFSCISMFLYFAKKYSVSKENRYLLFSAFLYAILVLIRPLNGVIIFLLPFLFKCVSTLLHAIKKTPLYYLLLVGFLVVTTLFIQPYLWYLQCNQFLVWSYGEEGFYFSNPQIYEVLLGFRKGWLIYTPIIGLALLGLVPLYKRSKEEFISLFLFLLVLIYLISSWWNWIYGSSFGQRVFVDFYGLFTLLLAFFLSAFKRAIIKVAATVVISFMIFLNLFQTYQYRENIISSWDMNFEKYKATFLVAEAGKVKIGGNRHFLPYGVNKQTVLEWREDFETNENFATVNDTVVNSKVADYSDREYNVAFRQTLDREFSTNRGLYFELSMQTMEKELGASDNAKLIIEMKDSLGQSYHYYWFLINETSFKKVNEWKLSSYKVLLPETKTMGDQLIAYIRNEDKKAFYLDEMKVKISTLNAAY